MRLVLAWVLVAGCGDDVAPAIDMAPVDTALDQGGAARCTRCTSPRAAVSRGPGPAILAEASGLAASQALPGVLYAHNDSGDAPQIFALDADDGGLLATISLTGATHVDYEDIAVAPCAVGAASSCVYVGDIGDNGLVRDAKTIYRFPEPALTGAAISVTAEAIAFQYPDGRHNAETLIVHPVTGAIYVVTKEAIGVASSVYRVDLVPATQVATLPFPTGAQLDVSGGDIDACGDTILLRLGSSALYALDGDFTATPRSLPIVQEANGEAIAWNATGTGYFTISEGAGAALNYVDCP